MKKFSAFIVAVCFIVIGSASAQAVTEIQWWFAHGGRLGEIVQEMVKDFNESQSDYKVEAVFKGSYAETMTAGIAAFRANEQPHILQVFEVGTATMMAAKGAIVPVYQLMADTGEPFDPDVYLSTVTGYYTTPDGKMLSLPFNSSTPVLYYNVEAFEKAGLDPETPPKTWPEVGEYAKKLIAAGYECGFSTAWTSWIHMENFSAWHNLPIGTQSNGFGGIETEFVFNNQWLVDHIQQLADWQKEKIFVYGGRTNQGNTKFSGGECAMYTESSAGYAGFKDAAKFDFSTGMLPYWPDVEGAPQNTIIGGASLWVMAGHTPEEYKGVAKFFSYLSSPEVQAKWHQLTGYLPITRAAYELTKQEGFYEKNPGTETALLQMTLNDPTEYSRGLRFGNFVQMRDVMDNEFEAVFSGQKSAQQAMDDAAAQGNELLRKFEKANK
ncbi:sn-glycerol-3-phosphate ABC transporter substrate-binding protein UgpB [candidate division KSB3 bacterium]|uniref:sn-glycerol-3-phosphate ABC transporter substrate-binding protein UgpB n=1 Tax=candidate division KSB3 bacterium TaxID=2044937 RepID=A0A2G6E7N1_9BACT|nr:MAG: sn-glycerol-3-phosphate ABC transporter substrate-binding protein UgpB [candidate division KSB3 bacterium]PIE30463.1 MAG: sn-glycerol-3-phosphate ABC transporter substrate-binding protein UgpB [candidate division KSB3 bacterium]